MVGTLKKWLGIDVLERENLTLAKALKAAHRRIGEIESAALKDREATVKLSGWVESLEKDLTPEASAPKIVPKPKPVTWKHFRSAIEKASEPQEESA
jgi:hypothetical protein